jgi:hypothetical protein
VAQSVTLSGVPDTDMLWPLHDPLDQTRRPGRPFDSGSVNGMAQRVKLNSFSYLQSNIFRMESSTTLNGMKITELRHHINQLANTNDRYIGSNQLDRLNAVLWFLAY